LEWVDEATICVLGRDGSRGLVLDIVVLAHFRLAGTNKAKRKTRAKGVESIPEKILWTCCCIVECIERETRPETSDGLCVQFGNCTY
jgi:hypothetical protein